MRATDPAYSRYARHYDQIGQRRFGEISARNLLKLLTADSVHIRSVIDLACGTGAASVEFAMQSLDVTGLDISPEMLERAALAASGAGVDVRWVEGDMTAFAPLGSFDLCTCLYDAVNYLGGLSDVTALFRGAHKSLNPGGHFAFDINTRRKLSEHWSEMTLIAANDADRFLTYRSWFDEERGISPLIITGFERQADGSWSRFDEEHVESAFAIEQLTAALAGTGFEQIRLIDWREGDIEEFAPGSEESFRVMFIARKPVSGPEA